MRDFWEIFLEEHIEKEQEKPHQELAECCGIIPVTNGGITNFCLNLLCLQNTAEEHFVTMV